MSQHLHRRQKKPSKKPRQQTAPSKFTTDSIPQHTQLTPDGITALQRLIGNQQVLTMIADNPTASLLWNNRMPSYSIAREPTSDVLAPEKLLTPAQVASAIAYHMNQPWRYTPEIIMQIQTEVGTIPTGKMREVDIQAVAKRQHQMNLAGEKPELKVDGMAGPRTLPSIFKIGLAKQKSIDTFSDKSKELLANPEGKSDQEVALEICAEANKRLTDNGIPELEPLIVPSFAGRGAFDDGNWRLLINGEQFVNEKLKNMKRLTSTIYHEARHAEQEFRVAQMLAGKKHSAEQIVAITGIKDEIAEIAARPENHIQPGTMEAVIAEGWHDSLHSESGKKTIKKNNDALDKAFAERQAAREAHEANPTPENKAKLEIAEANHQKAVHDYFDMPHEFDAERVAEKVEDNLGMN